MNATKLFAFLILDLLCKQAHILTRYVYEYSTRLFLLYTDRLHYVVSICFTLILVVSFLDSLLIVLLILALRYRSNMLLEHVKLLFVINVMFFALILINYFAVWLKVVPSKYVRSSDRVLDSSLWFIDELISLISSSYINLVLYRQI